VELSTDRFEFDFQITERNFMDTFELMQPRYFLISTASAAFVLLVGVWLLVANEAIWAVGLIAAGIAIVGLGNRWVLAWRYRRAARSTIGTTGHAAIDASGVEITHSAGSTRLVWSGLSDVRSTHRTLLFLRGKVMWGWVGIDSLDEPSRERLLAFVRAQVQRIP